MAITTYDELLTAGSAWITNTDAEARFPECVALAEGVANRKLDARQMYARDDAFAIAAAAVDLPARFDGVRAFYLNTSPPKPLVFVKADDFGDPREAGQSGVGQPDFYSLVGDQFVFSPAPDGTHTATLVYRQTLEALSESNASNWLLAAYPDVYLSGMLAFAYQYMEDDAMEGKFMSNFLAGIDQINTNDSRRAYGSAPSRRVRGFV